MQTQLAKLIHFYDSVGAGLNTSSKSYWANHRAARLSVVSCRSSATRIPSLHAPRVRCNAANCVCFQNCRVSVTYCISHPCQYSSQRCRFRRVRRERRTGRADDSRDDAGGGGGGDSSLELIPTFGFACTSLRTLINLCKAARYSLTFWSSDSDWS